MGVNHKTVKQLIAQKRKTVTDRQFFVSRILAGHFADMAAAQTQRYGYSRRVKVRIVWEPKNGSLACTENEFVWINAGHPFVTKKRSRQERYSLVCGLFAHELGHILYTDFLAGQTQMNKLEVGKWYPEKPLLHNADERRHEADIWYYVKTDEKHMLAFLQLVHNVRNILEDGYIESKLLSRYPGVLGNSLRFMRETQFEETPTLTQMIEHESTGSHIWLSITSLMLSYALWGELKYGDEPLSDERVQVVFSLIAEMDNALTNPSAKERLQVVNTIVIRCWPYIKDFLDVCIQKSEDAEKAGGSTSASDFVSELMSALVGASQEGTGDSTPVAEKPRSKNNAPSAGAKRAATAKLAEESEADDEAPSAENDEDFADDGMSAQDVSGEESGRIPSAQTDRLSEPTGGQTEFDGEYGGAGYAGAASDIERILNRVAENAVHRELESARTDQLNELTNSISYGDIHDGVNKKVHRMAETPEELVEAYKKAAPPLLHISKLLQRSITQHLQDKRRGGKQTGLLMGRRLDMHALPRKDGRVFYKNALPAETPELAVGLLLDESGSMSSQDRATYARAAAIILHDFCHALNIPVMVYGHATSCGGVDLYSYAEFDAIDNKDCYRLMDISARGSNRDGAALRFVAEQLAKRHEDVRILILISDGQPADTGYYGTAAEEDLRGIQHEYQRKGIFFIAASIGDDRESLQRIYGDAYMDITDLSRLPIQLTNVVKRHIKV
jgi:hypothetical protein